MITVTIPGRPAPQGSKRHIGHGRMIESSKAVGPWRERIAWFTANAMNTTGATITSTAVTVRLDFVLPRPASAPKRSTPAATKRPDLDKLARAVLDAITGIAITDDSQVIELAAAKRIAEIGEQPGLTIRINHEESR